MDFVQVAGPLGVTHFMIVSRTDSHINLRLCCLPRGPTITFHVNNVCVCVGGGGMMVNVVSYCSSV